MKKTALAIALLMSGAAMAQTNTQTDDMTQPQPSTAASMSSQTQTDAATQVQDQADVPTGTQVSTSASSHSQATTASHSMMNHNQAGTTSAASGQMIQPGNQNPERDARGIAVISDPAIAPAGWNAAGGTAMGGPLLDPNTGQSMAAENYPACSATVTDNCVQTYERGRRGR